MKNLTDVNWKWNELGAEFYNMGMMVINSKKFLSFLKGQTAEQFIRRPEFKDFVDGIGYSKWSNLIQMLLNYWVKKENIPTQEFGLEMEWFI